MTWGSLEAGDGNTCLRCKHHQTCRAACRVLKPVLCEDRPNWRTCETPPDPPAERRALLCDRSLAALKPGEEFTARQFANRIGYPNVSSISSWCSVQANLGVLIRVGQVPVPNARGGASSANLYRFSPPEAPSND